MFFYASSAVNAFCFLVSTGSLQADATNFSGLKGADLKPASLNLGSIKGIGDILNAGSRLLSSKSKDGKIESANVLEDRAESIKLKISYKSLKADGQTLTVFASDDGIKPAGGFESGQANLTNREGEAVVTVKLSSSVASGTEVRTKFLVVTIGKGSTLNVAVNQPFEASKNWKKRVTEIPANPIGQAASLPPTEPVAAPSGGFKRSRFLKPTSTVMLKPSSTILFTPAKTEPVKPVSTNPATTMVLSPAFVNFATLKPIGTVSGLPQEVKDSGGRGPDLQKGIPLFDEFNSDIETLRADQAMNIFPMVFEDANPASNTYYYLPKAYKLAWDSEKGYGFKFLYGAQRGDSPNSVTIAARVTSAVPQSDVNMLKSTLAGWCAANGKGIPKLRPFPILNAPECTLKGELSRYDIPDNKVFIVEGAPDASEFNVAITTDTVTKENIQLALTEGVGLNGFVRFKAGADGAGDVNVPLAIKFGDKGSFGSQTLNRSAGARVPFQNKTPFPLRLDFVHVLRKVGTGFRVYSYELGGAEVPSGDTSYILTNRIPGWLDNSADTKRIWVDYTVLQDEQATQSAINDATGGVSSMTQGDITFTTLSPLADTGVKIVLMEIKSKYFDSRGAAESVKTLMIDKDGQAFKTGPVFLVNRQPGEAKPGDPLFQYRLKLIFADGREKQSKVWTEANDMNLFLGKVQVQKVIDEPDGSN